MEDLENKLVKDYPHLKRATIRSAIAVMFSTLLAGIEEGYKVRLWEFGVFHTKEVVVRKMSWLEKQPDTVRKVFFRPSNLLYNRARKTLHKELADGQVGPEQEQQNQT